MKNLKKVLKILTHVYNGKTIEYMLNNEFKNVLDIHELLKQANAFNLLVSSRVKIQYINTWVIVINGEIREAFYDNYKTAEYYLDRYCGLSDNCKIVNLVEKGIEKEMVKTKFNKDVLTKVIDNIKAVLDGNFLVHKNNIYDIHNINKIMHIIHECDIKHKKEDGYLLVRSGWKTVYYSTYSEAKEDPNYGDGTLIKIKEVRRM